MAKSFHELAVSTATGQNMCMLSSFEYLPIFCCAAWLAALLLLLLCYITVRLPPAHEHSDAGRSAADQLPAHTASLSEFP